MMDEKWISVDDRLPEGECLVYLKNECLGRHIHSAIFDNSGINYIGNHFEWDMRHYGVIFWQPLPEPPKGVEG